MKIEANTFFPGILCDLCKIKFHERLAYKTPASSSLPFKYSQMQHLYHVILQLVNVLRLLQHQLSSLQ